MSTPAQHTILHYGKHHLAYKTHKSSYICVFTALSDKDTHTHNKKRGDSLEHMHIETTEKRKGVGAAVLPEKGGSERKGSGRKSAR